MGLVDNLQKQVMGWGVLIMMVVVLSIVLLNFRDVPGNTDELNTTINTAVTAFQEPANWIQIVVIALIGVGIIGLFVYLFKKKGSGY